MFENVCHILCEIFSCYIIINSESRLNQLLDVLYVTLSQRDIGKEHEDCAGIVSLK